MKSDMKNVHELNEMLQFKGVYSISFQHMQHSEKWVHTRCKQLNLLKTTWKLESHDWPTTAWLPSAGEQIWWNQTSTDSWRRRSSGNRNVNLLLKMREKRKIVRQRSVINISDQSGRWSTTFKCKQLYAKLHLDLLLFPVSSWPIILSAVFTQQMKV